MHTLLLMLALTMPGQAPAFTVTVADHKPKHEKHEATAPVGCNGDCNGPRITALESQVASLEAALSNLTARRPQALPAPVAPSPQPTYRAAAPLYCQTYSAGSCANGQCSAPSAGGYRTGPLRRLFGR